METSSEKNEGNEGSQDDLTPMVTTTARAEATVTATEATTTVVQPEKPRSMKPRLSNELSKLSSHILHPTDIIGYGRGSKRMVKKLQPAAATATATATVVQPTKPTSMKPRLSNELSKLSSHILHPTDIIGYGRGSKRMVKKLQPAAATATATYETSAGRQIKSVRNEEHGVKKNFKQSKQPPKRKSTTNKTKSVQNEEHGDKKNIKQSKQPPKRKSTTTNNNHKQTKKPTIPGRGRVLKTGKWVDPLIPGNIAPTALGIKEVVDLRAGRGLSDHVEELRGENEAISLCNTVDSEAYSFTEAKGGTKIPGGGIQLGVREDYDEFDSTSSPQNTNEECLRVVVTFRQGVTEKNEVFEILPFEVIIGVVRTAYFDALLESMKSQSDKRLTPTILARHGKIFWSLVYLCTNGGSNKKKLRDMLHGTFPDLDWGHLERDGRMRGASDLTMNKALRLSLPDLMKKERKLDTMSDVMNTKYNEVIKLSAQALAYLKVANQHNTSPNKNLISSALFLVQFSLGDDFKYDQDDEIDSDEDDSDEDDDDSDEDDEIDSDEDDSDEDDDDINLMWLALTNCGRRLNKSSDILLRHSLDETFIAMIIKVLEAIRCLFYQTEIKTDGLDSVNASLACLQGARHVALSLMDVDVSLMDVDVRGPGTMVIASLTFALSAWLVHHNENHHHIGFDEVCNQSLVLSRGAVTWLVEFQLSFSLYFSALMLNADNNVTEVGDMRKFVDDCTHAAASIREILDEIHCL